MKCCLYALMRLLVELFQTLILDDLHDLADLPMKLGQWLKFYFPELNRCNERTMKPSNICHNT
jgi:hypothetical protein